MIKLMLAIVVLCVVAASYGLANGSPERSSAASVQLHTQPESGLPSKEFARLRSGQTTGGRSWAFFLYRADPAAVRPAVCLVGSLARKRNGGGASVLTGSPSCHASGRPGFWLLVAALGLRRPSMRLLALAFPRSVRRVELVHPSGRIDVRKPAHLTARQSARIGTHDLGFVVATDKPGDCYEGLRMLGRGGRVISRSTLAPC
jgi:hypothetical protein